MIQAVLFFLLGFLVAAGLALLAAPVLWRRAGELMRRRIEASMPLTREELSAEIDAVRAEHAMAMRRLEMKAEAIKKKAAQDLVEINRQRDEIKRLEEECAVRVANLAELGEERDRLAERLARQEEEAGALAASLAQAEAALAERQAEVADLSRHYQEASLNASSRQIELVAREADIERLNDTIGLLRSQRKEADRAMHDAVAARSGLEEALRIERTRAAELERKVERLIADMSTRDEKLERWEREIVRLKQKVHDSTGEAAAARLAEAEQARAALEAEVAELKARLSAPQADGKSDGAARPKAPARKSETERLQSRLTALMRENKKLRAQLADAPAVGQGDEALREQIASLAAEVVSVAAALEGPQSPIDKALGEPPPETAPDAPPRPISLAERVRALRQDAAAAE